MGVKVVSQIHDEVCFDSLKQAKNHILQSVAAEMTKRLRASVWKEDVVEAGQIRININNQHPVEILREHWVMGDWEVPSYMTWIVRDLVLDKEYELKPRRIGRQIADMEALALCIR